MARLRNRQIKATFYTDGELLRWPREKRFTYQGIWAMAEDSGCLEDDPFEWKLTIWSSPLDADITVEILTAWRDEYVEAGKLIPYVAQGKRYLFITNFHQHERPRNPQSPDLPLPEWVSFEVTTTKTKDAREHKVNSYAVDVEHPAVSEHIGICPGRKPSGDHDGCEEEETTVPNERRDAGRSVPTPRGSKKRSPVLSSPDQSCSALTCPEDLSEGAATPDAPPPGGRARPVASPGEGAHTLTRTLVGVYARERKQVGSLPTRRQKGILASLVDEKLRGGMQESTGEEAIRRMVRKGDGPNRFPAFVDEVEAERRQRSARESPAPVDPETIVPPTAEFLERLSEMRKAVGRPLPSSAPGADGPRQVAL